MIETINYRTADNSRLWEGYKYYGDDLAEARADSSERLLRAKHQTAFHTYHI